MGDLDDIMDDASADALATSPRQIANDKESVTTSLFAAAARMTPELDEQMWLVAMCVHAGRSARYLNDRLAAQAAKGRPTEAMKDGTIRATAPLGLTNMRLTW